MQDNILPEQQNLLGGFSVALSAPCFNFRCFPWEQAWNGTTAHLWQTKKLDNTAQPVTYSMFPGVDGTASLCTLRICSHWWWKDCRTAKLPAFKCAEVKLLSAVSKGLVPCLQHRGCYRRVIKRRGVCHLDSQNSWHSISAKILLPVHWEIRRKTNKQTTSIDVSILIAQLCRNLLKLISWS